MVPKGLPLGPKAPPWVQRAHLEAEDRLKGPLGPIGDPGCYPHWGGYWYLSHMGPHKKVSAPSVEWHDFFATCQTDLIAASIAGPYERLYGRALLESILGPLLVLLVSSLPHSGMLLPLSGTGPSSSLGTSIGTHIRP